MLQSAILESPALGWILLPAFGWILLPATNINDSQLLWDFFFFFLAQSSEVRYIRPCVLLFWTVEIYFGSLGFGSFLMLARENSLK
jgi:hypothetical protein